MTTPSLRIACLGANLESLQVLDAFAAAGIRPVGVIGADEQRLRGISDAADIGAHCRAHDIALHASADANDAATARFLYRCDANALFVLGWSQLLDATLLERFPGRVIGSHPTPLPEGRGRAPVPWTILTGRRRSAVTLFRMTPAVDAGEIVWRSPFDVPPGCHADELYALVAHHLATAFVGLHHALEHGTLEPPAPLELPVSTFARRRPADGLLDFSHSAQGLMRLVRAVGDPYPGAYHWWRDRRLAWHRSHAATGEELGRHGVPGQVLACRGDARLVQAGDRPLWLASPRWPDSPADLVTGALPALGDVLGLRVQDELAALRARTRELERDVAELRALLVTGRGGT